MSSACFHFQSEPVSNQRNEFTIRGLSLMIIHRIAEKGIDGVYLTSVPCNLDGVADGPFHAAGSRIAFLRDRRIQFLCNVPAAAGGCFIFSYRPCLLVRY